MYNTIGQRSADLASRLFSVINRRNELKSQGKLAELQANLQREERQYASTQQRLRDRDYQQFQEGMLGKRQEHAKKERIAGQTFQSVQAKRQRDFAAQQAELARQEQQNRDLMAFERANLLRQMDYYRGQIAEAKTKAEASKFQSELDKVTNLLLQYDYAGVKAKSPATRSALGSLFPRAIPGRQQQIPEALLRPMVQELMQNNFINPETQRPYTYQEGVDLIHSNIKNQGFVVPHQQRQFFGLGIEGETLKPGQHRYSAGQAINRAFEGAINPPPKDRGFISMIPPVEGATQTVMNPFTNQMTPVTAGTSLYDLQMLQQYSDAYRQKHFSVYGGGQ
jgi:hypothetical protein